VEWLTSGKFREDLAREQGVPVDSVKLQHNRLVDILNAKSERMRSFKTYVFWLKNICFHLDITLEQLTRASGLRDLLDLSDPNVLNVVTGAKMAAKKGFGTKLPAVSVRGKTSMHCM
jgi:hypothetical protein